MSTDTVTIEQFISKHNLKFECRPAASNPQMEAREHMTRHFRCKVTAHASQPLQNWKRSFSFYFSQDSAHTVYPTLADVLDCLASDASGYDDAYGFEEWADNYGYDTYSRKAEKTFKAIKRSSEQMKRTLGAEAYEELLYNTERL